MLKLCKFRIGDNYYTKLL